MVESAGEQNRTIMPTFMIHPEPLPGPTHRIEEPPTLMHPHGCAISDLDDRAIWRYMDLPKYLSLLSTSALYFTRADQLTEMDPMERSWGQPDLEGEMAEANAKARRSLHEIMGKDFVNCWHLNEYESAAMWDIYGNIGASVAIKTSLRRFSNMFSTGDFMDADRWRMVPLEVRYLDYRKEGVGYRNAFDLLRSKRKSYEHEREIRMTLTQPVSLGVDDLVGVHLRVDLPAAVDGIYVNPRAPRWVFEAVTTTSERFGINPSMIHQSALDETPLL